MDINDEAYERAKRYIPDIFFAGMDMTSARISVHNAIAKAILELRGNREVSGDTDIMKLLTKLVNELREENAQLKDKLFRSQAIERIDENHYSRCSSLSSQIGDIEAGKVVPR